ncbi:hypothetical protein MH050_06740 [Bacillus licheniformis]|uniref:hypothetical protein n=1 Tax=Bacillus licheniformis TaxID=1402 RepID=UPI0011BDABAB|nr:hypothetical protein [Bacillus licheniformis]MCA1182071.1 hypothetical protein [Bacillus licheniformis]MCY7740550.1 hypothetical protein [Bacillus licheniformis]TWK93999.1 hypothetical protein CHCC20327_3686 [Bacillus licheniformis]
MRSFYKSKNLIKFLKSIEVDGKRVKKIYKESYIKREKYKEQVIASLEKREIELMMDDLEDLISINKDTSFWHPSYFALHGSILTLFFVSFKNFLPEKVLSEKGEGIFYCVFALVILMYIGWIALSLTNKKSVTELYAYKRILEKCLEKINQEEENI